MIAALIFFFSLAHGADLITVENQQVFVQVIKDGTYTVTEKVDLSFPHRDSKDSSWSQKITYDPTRFEVEVLEAAVHTNGETKAVDVSKVAASHGEQGDSLLIPFEEMTPDSQVSYTLRRKLKISDADGVANLDFVYGLDKPQKTGAIHVSSELPLYFQSKDPKQNLSVELQQVAEKYELSIRLKKPVSEDLSRVQVSTVRTWADFSERNLANFQLDNALPEAFEKAAKLVGAAEDTRSRVEKLLLWMAENMTLAPSHGQNWRPRPMKDIAATLSGDNKDFARVALGILKAAGVQAEPVYIGRFPAGERRLHEPISEKEPLPSHSYFNYVAIRYKNADTWQIVDPARGLADAVHIPYYLNNALAMNLGGEGPYKIEITDPNYARAVIHTQMQRKPKGVFAGQSRVEFKGELGNFLKGILFSGGEAELRNYLETFSGFAGSFSYRKIDFVDRLSKDWAVEINFTTENSDVLVLTPHFVPFFAANLTRFPVQIEESTTVQETFVQHEEMFDCVLRGPAMALDRRVENQSQSVVFQDQMSISGKDVGLAADDARYASCTKKFVVPVIRRQPENVNFDITLNTAKPYAFPPGIQENPDALTVELRKIDLYLKAHPKAVALWRARGRTFRYLGHVSGDTYISEYLNEATKSFATAVALDPQDSASYGELGINYLFANKMKEGVEAFNQSSILDNRNFPALQLGGLISLRTKKYDLAVSYFASAAAQADLPEDQSWALMQESRTLCIDLNRCHEALSAVEKALIIRPKDPMRDHGAAIAFAHAGNLQRAVELEREAVALNDTPALRRQLESFLLAFDEEKMARKDLKREDLTTVEADMLEAYKLDAKNERILQLLTEAYVSLAKVTEDASKFAAAQKYFGELKALDTVDPKVVTELFAKLNSQAKKFERAPADTSP